MSSEHQCSSRDIVISVGRSYLQMIAAAHVLLEREPFWTEALLLKLVKVLYTHRLKGLLELLPEDMVAEILAEQDENGALVPFSSN